jgi:50S ribosomal protein L16 3-hydroxylase
LLVRGAFADFKAPLQPDDLAGLACEPAALARLIVHDEKRGRWHVNPGPLTEEDFSRTPDSNWTLLVQDVDKWDIDVAALLEPFAFLPSWRVDDVMISYAEPGGGVGAHVDHYDVFLLQGLGQRHWAISDDPAAPKDFRPDVELKQLAHFEPTHEWLLETGDMLYLPPGVAHDGVAFGGPCMTYSIGMRAPSQAELLIDFAETLAESVPETSRLKDPDLRPSRGDGEIDEAAIGRVMAAMPWFRWSDHLPPPTSSSRRTLGSSSLLRNQPTAKSQKQRNAGNVDRCSGELDSLLLRMWFGRFITRYRSAHVVAPNPRPPGDVAFARAIERNARVQRNPWARCAWTREGRNALLFVAGDMHACSVRLARLVAAQTDFALAEIAAGADDRSVLRALIAAGHLGLARAPRKRSSA